MDLCGVDGRVGKWRNHAYAVLVDGEFKRGARRHFELPPTRG
jgi:hypothetical protein